MMIQVDPILAHWRRFAQSFPALAKLVHNGSLPPDYQPSDLDRLRRQAPFTNNEDNVFQFLLHVWNRYDYEFELSQMLCWDLKHRQAFLDWYTGRTLGSPSRYF